MIADAPAALSIPPVAEGFSRLPLAAFWAAHRPQAALYVQTTPGRPPKLLCARGYDLRDEHLKELYDRGITSLLITNSELAEVAQDLQRSFTAIAANDSIAPHDRLAILEVAEATDLGTAFRLLDVRRAVEAARRVAKLMTSLLIEHEVSIPQLYCALQHDDRPSIRAINGAAYATALALRMGRVNGADEVAEMAAGAILRDVGERYVPMQILAKPTRLSPADRTLLEAHPINGYIDLRRKTDATSAQLMMVYQHHEWHAGGGYPVGVDADELHPWAEILAVADAFEALTGWRPYRDPLDATSALKQIEASSPTQFHPEVAACLLSAFRM